MKNKPVIRFFVRLAAFSVILFAADRLAGLALKKIYFSQRVGQYSQTTYALDSAKQDILIFGSSRAARHYSPSIISKVSGLSCYNSGRDGLMIPYAAAVQEVSLARHIPKMIILDISPRELGIDRVKYERLSILLPYCAEHEQLIKYVKEVSPYEPDKLISKTYPFNSSAFVMACNTLLAKSVSKDENGYLPLQNSLTKAETDDYLKRMLARAKSVHQKADVAEDKAVAYFKQFLDNTARYNIKTLVVISPTILKNAFYLDNKVLERRLIEEITGRYKNVTFLDYSRDPRFNGHPEKFADYFHLNAEGSTEFSQLIAQNVKANI
ncbi:MAG: hypothetical protein ACTHMI_02215 [Mucilaginibacter sp.]